jgi:hypothetical protein
VFAPPSTKGEHSTGWLRRQKARIAPSIVSSQTSGELPLQLPVVTGFSSMNASPNRAAHISITSSAFFGLVVMPMNILSECFIEE